MDLRSVVVRHEKLGKLNLEQVLRTGSAAVIIRARADSGGSYDVTVGRRMARYGPDRVSAFSSPGGGGPFESRSMTRSIIDAAIVAQAARLEEDGRSFRLVTHGLGEWTDPALSIRRPALVTEAVEGLSLSDLQPEQWREEAWHIISSLLVMVMVTPSGEQSPHGDLKAGNVILRGGGQLCLVDPGVELRRGEVMDGVDFDLEDRPGEEPWEEDEVIIITTLSAYPTFPPGTPGAELQAIGLMVYEGLAGTRALGFESPAPRSYNFGNGRHGRGVASPRIVIGEIPRLRKLDPTITRAMEAVVRDLLWAPVGHELSLGQGRSLRNWAAMCHEAAESDR